MKLNPFAVMREEFDGTGVVFNPDNNRVMTLNSAGVAVWRALERGASPDEAAQELLAEFTGVTAGQALDDVQKFIAELSSKALISTE